MRLVPPTPVVNGQELGTESPIFVLSSSPAHRAGLMGLIATSFFGRVIYDRLNPVVAVHAVIERAYVYILWYKGH